MKIVVARIDNEVVIEVIYNEKAYVNLKLTDKQSVQLINDLQDCTKVKEWTRLDVMKALSLMD